MPRIADLEVLAPVKGLRYDMPSTVIPKEASPAMSNVRLFNGVVQPSPGYSAHATVNTLLGIPQLYVEYVENDEDRHLLGFTTKYIYEYNTSLANWAKIVSRQAALGDGDAAWTASANVTATQSTDRLVGSHSAKMAIQASFTTGLAAYLDFVAVNTTSYSYIHYWIKSSKATSAGDLRLAIDNTSACASPLQYYDVPALAVNTWTQCEIAIASGSNAAVVSIGLDVVTDLGAMDVFIDNVIAVDRHTGTSTNRWSVAHHLDLFYATNGVDPIQRKDHSNNFDDWAEAVSASYKCRTLAAHADHLVMAYMIESGVEYPQRVRWTDSGAETFGGTAGSTETNGADACVALRPLGARLACYKQNSVVIITHIGGSTVYRFDRPVTGRGILGLDYVTDYGDLHCYVSKENVWIYDGGADPKPIGDPINDEFFRTISDAYVGNGFMYYNPQAEEIYIFTPTDGEEYANVIWTFHADLSAWSRRDHENMTAVGGYLTNSALTFGDADFTFGGATITFGDRGLQAIAPVILLGLSDGSTTVIDELTFSNQGAAITRYFDSPDITAARLPVQGDQPVRYTDNNKRWLRIAFEAKGSAIDIEYSTNEGLSYNSVKTVTLSNIYLRYFVSLDVSAPRLRVRFKNDDVAGSFYLRWYSVGVIGRSEV